MKSSRALVVVLSLLATVAGLQLSASAAARKCFGETPTQVGTNGDDRLRGTNRRDVIVSRKGDDVVRGLGRFDIICGGPGRDVLFGGGGGEFLFGGRGDDELNGGPGPFSDFAPGPGDDLVFGSSRAFDFLHFERAPGGITANLATGRATGQGSDRFVSGDALLGGRFGDTLIGNRRDNVLVGRGGDDDLRGRAGFDFISAQRGNDAIGGGPDFDIADYYEENADAGLDTSGPITVDLSQGTATGEGNDTLTGIEGATGSTGDDTMIGDDGDNAFFLLLGGADTATGNDGDDFFDAGLGADDVDGGLGTDTLGMFDGRRGAPRVTGVTLDLSTNTTSDGDTLAGVENAVGTFSDDNFTGDDGNNGLFSLDGDDQVAAGQGNDLVDPGNGTDDAQGGGGTDLLGNLDHFTGGLSIDLSTNTDSDGDTLGEFEDVLGTFFDDTITGDAGPNSLFGSFGNDVLNGLAGEDLLVGGRGFDTGDGGQDTDRCEAEQQDNCEFTWTGRLTGRAVTRGLVASHLRLEVLARLPMDRLVWRHKIFNPELLY